MKVKTMIRFYGTQANAAKALRVSQQAISLWLKKGPNVPDWWQPIVAADMKRRRNERKEILERVAAS